MCTCLLGSWAERVGKVHACRLPAAFQRTYMPCANLAISLESSRTMERFHNTMWKSAWKAKEHTSSTAQSGGGSFKNRKPIGEFGCCESRMAERIHWWTERWLRFPLFLSVSFSLFLCLSLIIYLPNDLSIYLSIYLSLSLFIHPRWSVSRLRWTAPRSSPALQHRGHSRTAPGTVDLRPARHQATSHWKV